MIILHGSSNIPLALEIASILNVPVADIDLSQFPNGEKRVWVKTPLQGKTVAIIQSFSKPVDDHIIEFTLLVDAAQNLGADKIIAVIPWFGYSPQDKEFRKGEPISARVLARIVQAVGVTSVVTVDIHSLKTLDFFQVPVIHLSALPLFVDYFKSQNLKNHIVVSVDKGALENSQKMAQALDLPLCIFEKQRDRFSGAINLKHISGEVKDKTAIAIDDFVSTGSTRIAASSILKSMGLKYYFDCITHAILAQDADIHLKNSLIDQIVTTNTYFIPDTKKFSKLKVISIAPVIAQSLKQFLP